MRWIIFMTKRRSCGRSQVSNEIHHPHILSTLILPLETFTSISCLSSFPLSVLLSSLEVRFMHSYLWLFENSFVSFIRYFCQMDLWSARLRYETAQQAQGKHQINLLKNEKWILFLSWLHRLHVMLKNIINNTVFISFYVWNFICMIEARSRSKVLWIWI